MTELRFAKDVYDGNSVDAAVQQFARYARLETIEAPGHWVVRVTAATPARERTVAGELGNHALGASAAGRKAVAP